MREIEGIYPARRSAGEKEAFRTWLEARCAELGYSLSKEENGRLQSVQLLAGDPEHAAVLFTCHYDTPARRLLPDLSFGQNGAAFVLWTLLEVLLMLIPAFLGYMLFYALTGSARTGLWAFVLVYLAELFWTRIGLARRKNPQQDTALAAMLRLMALTPEACRSQVAFLFLDGGEQGWHGAKAWCKAHPQTAYTRLTVEIGSLGLGKRLLCVESKLARKCTGYGSLCRALAENGVAEALSVPNTWSFLRGEDRAFKCGIGLYTARRLPILGDVACSSWTLPDSERAAQAEAVAASLADAIMRMTGAATER